MRRRLLNVLTALSLLPCVAVAMMGCVHEGDASAAAGMAAAQERRPSGRDDLLGYVRRAWGHRADDAVRLRDAYRRANGVNEKRDLCVQMLDKRLIVDGTPLEHVIWLFGDDFMPDYNRNVDGTGHGMLPFGPPDKRGHPDDWTGSWYLYVGWVEERRIPGTPDGRYVTEFHLSNQSRRFIWFPGWNSSTVRL